MLWLLALALTLIALAIGLAVGWELGYRHGRDDDLSEPEFGELVGVRTHRIDLDAWEREAKKYHGRSK